MKSLPVLLLSLLMGAGLTPLRAEQADTKASLQSANNDVQTSLQQVHQARQKYFNAVKASGQDSPEAKAAKTQLDTRRDAWRTKMANRRALRHQARHEMRHRHAGTSTAPRRR